MTFVLRVMPSLDDLRFETASLVGFRELVLELGADPGVVARRCDYKLDDLDTNNEPLEYQTYCRLLEAAATETGCPHFGLLLGQRKDLSLLGTLGLLSEQCPSFGDANQVIIRYYNIASLGEVFRLERGASTSVFIREPIIPELAYSIQTQDVTLCEIVQVTRALLGEQWAPTGIYLIHQPENTKIYHSVFGCPVYFNQDMQAVAFPTADLDRPLEKADATTRQNLEQRLATNARQQAKPFLLQTQEVIKLGLAMGDCGVKFAAANLSMHTRTLHRKLSREGTTFTEMLYNTRRQLANHLVTQTPMSIYDISQTLGYNDATAFSRSFRRWFGAGPSRWRKNNAR